MTNLKKRVDVFQPEIKEAVLDHGKGIVYTRILEEGFLVE